MTDDVPLRTPEQAEATAKRHNTKLAQRFPLLALSDQLDGQWTADRVLEDERRFRAKLAATDQCLRERGNYRKALCAQRVSAEQMSEWEDYFRRVLPQEDGGYAADYWFRRLRECWPERAWHECGNQERHTLYAKWHEVCPACGMKLRTNNP